MKEEVLFCNDARSLVGILTTPDSAMGEHNLPAVILVNAGLVHRIGPSRIYVLIARALARQHFNVLRLDLSGIGDSMPRSDTMVIEQRMLADVRSAMDTLTRTCGTERFILMGHCSGALLSLFVASQEPKVAAAVMINPEGGGEEWEEFDRQRKEATYYTNFYSRGALKDRQRLLKVLTGKADYRTIGRNILKYVLLNRLATLFFRVRTMLGKKRAAATIAAESKHEQSRMIILTASQHSKLLFIHTQGSTGYEHLRTIAGDDLDQLQARGIVNIQIIPAADHIFTLRSSQERLVNVIETWVGEIILHPQTT